MAARRKPRLPQRQHLKRKMANEIRREKLVISTKSSINRN